MIAVVVLVLLVLAFVAFVLAASNPPIRIALVPLGLALWVFAVILTKLPS